MSEILSRYGHNGIAVELPLSPRGGADHTVKAVGAGIFLAIVFGAAGTVAHIPETRGRAAAQDWWNTQDYGAVVGALVALDRRQAAHRAPAHAVGRLPHRGQAGARGLAIDQHRAMHLAGEAQARDLLRLRARLFP